MSHKQGFSLTKIIVVTTVLGILVAIIAPGFFNSSAQQDDSETRSNLSSVRRAIQRYGDDHRGALPGQTNDLPADLAKYLPVGFPMSEPQSNSQEVAYSTADPLVPTTTGEGWVFSTLTGEFIVNSVAPLASDSSITYDQL